MDKEQARFILRSFRPDGADAGDPDFAEALRLAAENRELGEWLASERAFDASFAEALGTVDLPETLREDIMACLAAERGDFPRAEDANDAAWIGALASIQPPAALRDQVLAAMDRTAALGVPVAGKISVFRRAAFPLAAAAGIALAFMITRPEEMIAGRDAVPIEVVKAGFVRTFESPSFALEEKREEHLMLVRHLHERKLPCFSCLPPGLAKVKGVGCRELVIDGKRGSLVCFKVAETGLVHLVIFKSQDVEGSFPGVESPIFARDGKWATARWTDSGKVFLALSATELGKLEQLF